MSEVLICSAVSGNAHLVALQILEKAPDADSRVSYAQERHLFHVAVARGFTFLCMASEEVGRRIPYAFLDDIKQRFFIAYGNSADTALAYELNEGFAKVLQERMSFFSSGRAADPINRIQGELGEVRTLMIKNIDQVLDRGERIELLVDKTDHFHSDAFKFTRSSRQLKRKMWWRSGQMLAVTLVLLLLIAYVIVCFACSPTFKC